MMTVQPYFTGHRDKHFRGVALVISREKANTLLEREPISDWMIKARFNSKHCKCVAARGELSTVYKITKRLIDSLQSSVRKTTFKSVTTGEGSHSCSSTAKFSVESFFEESRRKRIGCLDQIFALKNITN